MLCYWLNKLLYYWKHNGMVPIKTYLFTSELLLLLLLLLLLFTYTQLFPSIIYNTVLHELECYWDFLAFCSPVVNIYTNCCNTHKVKFSNRRSLCILYTLCTNTDYISRQHEPICLYNAEGQCSLWGTNSSFVYDLHECRFSKCEHSQYFRKSANVYGNNAGNVHIT
jgi:hypothetical protein